MKKLLAAILVLNLALFSGSLLAKGKKDKDHGPDHEHHASHEHGHGHDRSHGRGHDRDHSNETGRHHGRGHHEHDHDTDDDGGAVCEAADVEGVAGPLNSSWTYELTLSGVLCTTPDGVLASDQLTDVIDNFTDFTGVAACTFNLASSDKSDDSNIDNIVVDIVLFDCRDPL